MGPPSLLVSFRTCWLSVQEMCSFPVGQYFRKEGAGSWGLRVAVCLGVLRCPRASAGTTVGPAVPTEHRAGAWGCGVSSAAITQFEDTKKESRCWEQNLLQNSAHEGCETFSRSPQLLASPRGSLVKKKKKKKKSRWSPAYGFESPGARGGLWPSDCQSFLLPRPPEAQSWGRRPSPHPRPLLPTLQGLPQAQAPPSLQNPGFWPRPSPCRHGGGWPVP